MEQEKKEVVISEDDVKNVRNFFSQFNSPIPSHLEESLNDFTNNSDSYTIEQQGQLKVSIARSLLEAKEGGSDLLKDILSNEVWDGVMNNCQEAHFNAQFDETVVEELGKTPEEAKTPTES